jgi:hypothetical protein
MGKQMGTNQKCNAEAVSWFVIIEHPDWKRNSKVET